MLLFIIQLCSYCWSVPTKPLAGKCSNFVFSLTRLDVQWDWICRRFDIFCLFAAWTESSPAESCKLDAYHQTSKICKGECFNTVIKSCHLKLNIVLIFATKTVVQWLFWRHQKLLLQSCPYAADSIRLGGSKNNSTLHLILKLNNALSDMILRKYTTVHAIWHFIYLFLQLFVLLSARLLMWQFLRLRRCGSRITWQWVQNAPPPSISIWRSCKRIINFVIWNHFSGWHAYEFKMMINSLYTQTMLMQEQVWDWLGCEDRAERLRVVQQQSLPELATNPVSYHIYHSSDIHSTIKLRTLSTLNSKWMNSSFFAGTVRCTSTTRSLRHSTWSSHQWQGTYAILHGKNHSPLLLSVAVTVSGPNCVLLVQSDSARIAGQRGAHRRAGLHKRRWL